MRLQEAEHPQLILPAFGNPRLCSHAQVGEQLAIIILCDQHHQMEILDGVFQRHPLSGPHLGADVRLGAARIFYTGRGSVSL